ncbi:MULTISPECIES: glutamate synthase large subunit [Pseudanabaena]|uniref:glutamate synthase (ferredoxin) n=2 Tax=Pseudanabaena TaxID=1152 RepID=L8N1Z2_9CYAN|nr:glutamate synthase large subunit [Pseudanabaena catenata]ELS34222.1 glutamate synthase (ferredoxin) [Pseudanabaena biceps PCC 7429]MDG3493579.1 glutamate synthase large subunit [Pseudanabaena catenata USMAC16]
MEVSRVNTSQSNQSGNTNSIQGPYWLVEERDACGVGFIADKEGRASYKIISNALKALTCMEHRGGCSADQDSGDGAGLMTAIPWALLQKEFTDLTIDPEHSALGMFFLPQESDRAAKCREITTRIAAEEGLKLLRWRVVPVRPEVLGIQARANQPQIEQAIFVADADHQNLDQLERAIYITRRRIKLEIRQLTPDQSSDFYVPSLSNATVIYKGMVRSAILDRFYEDLQNPDYVSPYAIYHRRFSTNTLPKWPLAQPMRFLGHNGEINTLQGNTNWFLARQGDLAHPNWVDAKGDRLKDLLPILKPNESDSATLDHVFELLIETGHSPLEAMMILVPEAYENQPDLSDRPEITDFYEYYSGLQEAWDGPALLAFSDGKIVGAALDRNGLRPARYMIAKDGMVIVSSEAGTVDIPESEIIEKGRLGPGQMIAVDLQTHEILHNWEIKERVAKAHPYGEWTKQYRKHLESQPFHNKTTLGESQALTYQTAFGYTLEDVEMVIEAMAQDGKEPVFCMGDDAPLAFLSQRPHLLYDYFKQRFAQVTNPPIDPLREGTVMSLSMFLGERANLLIATPEAANQIKIKSPVINEVELEELQSLGFATKKLDILFPIASGATGLKDAIAKLSDAAVAAVRDGAKLLILSDRDLNAENAYIPPLLAVGAVHHRLCAEGLRMKASIVVDTAQCWSTHHFACLIGYGASAICPYLAFETTRQWWGKAKTQMQMQQGKIKALTIAQVQDSYRKAVEGGLLKILSKMGISLLSSYSGAQIFEAIGIGTEVIEHCFKGTVSRVGGVNFADIASELLTFHAQAFPELLLKKLENYGFVQYRPTGEYHMNSPEMAKALHKAVAGDGYDHYEVYRTQLQNRTPTALRDLLEFKSDRPSIPVEEVEDVSEILKRFCTGAMSLGALSREAHEVLAIAMNRVGGKSNCGEGGEDPIRYLPINDVDANGISATFPHLKGLKNGDTANSAIKQIASGRFGVTPSYLVSSNQLEIKVAQGAKPGEGGQLPGPKVSSYIAMLRNSKPGVSLISPPPHHDIYSIEDLAQLIFDLHQINPTAKVSVKLVSEIGIGTIAAGVAKANADIIQISGYDGGTGASPLSSIKHAGSPWELGLAEVHTVLMGNKLRDRVLLRVDGGFKTGWDVAIAALLGGEEFGFGTAAMIAEGCIMARVCHTNKCPVGVTSQLEQFRKRFLGTPEHVVNFLYFVAEEVRQILAKLGYKSLKDIIGRSDLLIQRQDLKLAKLDINQVDMGCLINLPDTKSDRGWLEHSPVSHSNGAVLDDEILADLEVQAAIANQTDLSKTYAIVNTDRSVPTRVSGAIAKQYGNSGLASSLHLQFVGAAGQSFGAFNINGLHLSLAGEANDYIGKGMNGGSISIKPKPDCNFNPADNAIVGNTCLYGATGGYLFVHGRAGERFGVRNSGAKAVVEGTGDHCCEYMTGGAIVVLGTTGRNVGAGMTGGIAYFLDIDGKFKERLSQESLKVQRVSTVAGENQLKELIQSSYENTGSSRAKEVLDNWSIYLPKFWQVVPPSEQNSPEATDELPVVATV